jgi:hypothetical protein
MKFPLFPPSQGDRREGGCKKRGKVKISWGILELPANNLMEREIPPALKHSIH